MNENITCLNCGYEVGELNQITDFCDTCQSAYEIGLEAGKAEA
jgi:hypothetical protein